MNHEERVRQLYPNYNKVGENFKPKKEWPKDKPLKKNGKKIKIFIILIFGIIIGMGIIIGVLYQSEILRNYYTNNSYSQGVSDAAFNIMEYTRTTGTTYIILNDSMVQLQCRIAQNINNITGGK